MEFCNNQVQQMNKYLVSKFDSSITEIKKIFQAFDEDNSGTLDTNEVGLLLQQLEENLTEEEI